MTTISFANIFPIEQPSLYKLHFARHNGHEQPLDVFVRSRKEWQRWQEYKPNYNQFNRPYIFSVIKFYHEPDIWLFGGIWEILERLPDSYVVSPTDRGRHFIGRLKLHYHYRQMPARVNLERHLDKFTVSEILREEYSGLDFPGHDRIDIGFGELKALIHKDRPDWRGALENTKGVYLIGDGETGRLYVGSAYGDGGVWSRWREYIDTGHGGNAELKKIVKDRGQEYCQRNFRFSLLESHAARIADEVIVERESHWKRILRSRGEFGLNRN